MKPDQADATCPVLIEKIIRFSFHPNQIYKHLVPTLSRGVSRSPRTLGAECDGRGNVEATNDTAADGEVVWSRYPDADIKWAMMLSHHADDGGNKARLTEEITK